MVCDVCCTKRDPHSKEFQVELPAVRRTGPVQRGSGNNAPSSAHPVSGASSSAHRAGTSDYGGYNFTSHIDPCSGIGGGFGGGFGGGSGGGSCFSGGI